MNNTKNPFADMGCTCFTWETKDNMHLLGRTYDQCGNLKGNRIAVVPRNYPLKLEINEKYRDLCEAGMLSGEWPLPVWPLRSWWMG